MYVCQVAWLQPEQWSDENVEVVDARRASTEAVEEILANVAWSSSAGHRTAAPPRFRLNNVSFIAIPPPRLLSLLEESAIDLLLGA